MAEVAPVGFRKAMDMLSREERFMATVSAMNTLMIEKGVYTSEEFQAYYCQWAEAQQRKDKRERTGWRVWLGSRVASLFCL